MFFLIFKRFVLGLITLFIVSLITFIGVEILPGDACTSYLEREAFGEVIEKYEQLDKDIQNVKKEKYGFLQRMRLGDVKEQPKELLPSQ